RFGGRSGSEARRETGRWLPGMSRDGRRVVVTGMGTLNPLGKTVEEYWDGLVEGRSGAAPIAGVDARRRTANAPWRVHGFHATDYMDRKLAQRSARFTHLAIASCGQAIADAELDLAGEDRYRVGVEMGTGIGGFEVMTRDAATYLNGGRLQPLYATMVI